MKFSKMFGTSKKAKMVKKGKGVSLPKESPAAAATADPNVLLEFQAKNIKLARDLQQQKMTNGQLVNKIVELSRSNQRLAEKNNRHELCFQRLSQSVGEFVTVMVKGSQLVDQIVKEMDIVRSFGTNQLNDSQGEPSLSPNEFSTSGSGEGTGNASTMPSSPSKRTGVTKPMVKGLTISKPSVSLQRFHPGHPPQFIPMPVRGLHITDIIGPSTPSPLEGLSNISEEDEANTSVATVVPPEDAEEPREPATVTLPTVIVESPSESEPMESSDDENIEMSLIEARRQLVNSARRKDLKEGTSKDYDDRGVLSVNNRRKPPRKRPASLQRKYSASVNGVSASDVTKSGSPVNIVRSILENSDSLSENGNGSPTPEVQRTSDQSFKKSSLSPIPRVNITRLKKDDIHYHEGSVSESTVGPSEVLEDREDREIELEESMDASFAAPISAPSYGCITTRKRSAPKRRFSGQVSSYSAPKRRSSDQVSSDDDEPLAAKQTALKRKRRSWADLMRKRANSGSSPPPSPEGAVHVTNGTRMSSPRPKIDLERRLSIRSSTDDLPTVVLKRCSVKVSEDRSSEPKRIDLNNSATLRSLGRRDVEDASSRVSNGFSSELEMPAKRPSKAKTSKPKTRSKPKASGRSIKLSGRNSLETKKPGKGRNDSDCDVSKTASLESSLRMNSSNMSSFVSETESSVTKEESLTEGGRPRRGTAPKNLREKPLNVKMRRM